MTLCMAWRNKDGTVHFASDSRYTLASNSYADVAIKVLSLPLTILNPAEPGNSPRTVYQTMELGMCFAGSAINSLAVKNSVVEALKSLQFAPGYTDTSMKAIAGFVFTAYKIISKEVCATSLAERGRANILLGGMCAVTNTVRVFQFLTDEQNQHSLSEILIDKDHAFIGAGAQAAEDNLPQDRNDDAEYLNVLKLIIDDPNVPSVGGHIQYGRFRGSHFVVYGILELDGQDAPAPHRVHYWRGALDLNSKAFLAGHDSFVPGVPLIDPFSVIGGI